MTFGSAIRIVISRNCAARYPLADRALVRCHVRYCPREDNLPEILSEITQVFPRCYERRWTRRNNYRPPNESSPRQHLQSDVPLKDVLAAESFSGQLAHGSERTTVESYLRNELPESDPDREELLALLNELMEDRS